MNRHQITREYHNIVLLFPTVLFCLLSACSTIITPRVTEETKTAIPTKTKQTTLPPPAIYIITGTPEPSPTTEPTPTPKEIKLSEDELRELVKNLNCQEDEGCVGGEHWDSSGSRGAGLNVVATGAIKTINVLHPANGNKIAEAEVAVFITKDLVGNPQLLYVVVQLRPVETLEINVNPFTSYYVGDESVEFYNENPYTTETLSESFYKGKYFTFLFPSNYDEMVVDFEYWPLPYKDIVIEIYSDNNYIKALQQFIETQRYIDPDGYLLIFPYSGSF